MDQEFENTIPAQPDIPIHNIPDTDHAQSDIPVPPFSNPIPPYSAPVYSDADTPRFIPDPPKKKNKAGFVFGMIALCLLCSIMGGLIGALAYHLVQPEKISISASKDESNGQTDETDPPNETVTMQEGDRDVTVLDPEKIPTGELLTPAQVYAKYVNSTVGITTAITTNYFGYQSTSAASGSGFILTEDGYILTNHHVIEGSSSITVAMFDGTEYDAQVIGYDESNDIAVLKIDAKGLQPVVLGNSDQLNVGDSVLAIGNPLGELTFSLTAGAVSALNRDVTFSNGLTMSLIQTDCAINSGNSGGALFNLYGEVVGITNAKYSGSSMGSASIDNIGFAIPINDVRKIIDSIIQSGFYAKPYIGVSVVDVSAEAQKYGLPMGAAVELVAEGGPCEQAGLQEGDIITHLDDVAVTGSSDLVKKVGKLDIGQTVKMTVYRKGKTITIEVKTVERPTNNQ